MLGLGLSLTKALSVLKTIIRDGLRMLLRFEKSEILGEDIIVNGDFSTGDITGWAKGGTDDDTVEVVDHDGKTDVLYVDASAITRGVNQDVLDSNTQYLVKFDLKVISGEVFLGKTNNRVTGGALNPSSWTSYEVNWTSDLDTVFRIYSSQAAAEFYVDNVSVQEVTQIAPDKSGNSNGATLYTGKALSFDGVNDYVDFGSDVNNNRTVWTTAIWISNFTASSSLSVIYGRDNTRIIGLDRNGNVFYRQDGDGNTYNEFDCDVFNTSFTGAKRLVFTSDGTDIKLYLDGVYIDKVTPSTHTELILQRLMAGYSTSAHLVDATVSDFQLYNATWTQTDVTFDYDNPQHLVTDNSASSIALSNLKGYWHLSEGAGGVVYDSSGENNDGTAYDGNANDHDNDGTVLGATWAPRQPTIPQLGLMDWSKGSNLITYSEDFSNAGWNNGSNATVTSGFTSPTGLSTAYRMNASADEGNIRFTSPTINPDNLVSVSIFAKKGTTTKLKIVEESYIGKQTTFDLNSGSIDAGGNTTSSSIESYGDGWYRCSITQAYSSGQTSAVWAFMAPTAGNLFLWGAQIEEAPSPSAYRKTKGSTVIDATLISDPNDPSKDILDNSVRLREHSLNLDGSGYAEVADDNTLDFGTGAFSIDGWAKYTFINSGSSSGNAIYSNGSNLDSTTTSFAIATSTNGGAREVRFYINGQLLTATVTSDVADGAWFYFAGTRDASGNFKLYINNENPVSQSQTGNSGASVSSPNVKHIGRDYGTQKFYKNLIDDIRLYKNKELSADEIEQNYKAGLSQHKPGSSFSDDFSSDYGF